MATGKAEESCKLISFSVSTGPQSEKKVLKKIYQEKLRNPKNHVSVSYLVTRKTSLVAFFNANLKMTSFMCNSESFFDYNFKRSATAKDNFQVRLAEILTISTFQT